MSLVKVCVLTKNEYDLIEDFILYYGSLFGFCNVHIVDNGSTHPHVLSVYEKYKPLGVDVVIDKTPLNNHGEIVTKHIKRLKSAAKFVVPLDTDEFMFFTDGSEINKSKMMQYFESIPEDVSIVRFKNFYGSSPEPTSPTYVNYKHTRPARDITGFYDQNWDKIFVRASKYISSSTGNHSANVSSGTKIVSDKLGLLHFHETGVFRQYERAIQAVQGRNHVNPTDDIDVQINDCLRYIGGVGGHHCGIYLFFLARMLLIALWNSRFNAMPSKDDMMWVHKHANDHDLMAKVVDYVSKANHSASDLNRSELIFNFWPEVRRDFIISSVSDYLKNLPIS